MKRIQTMLQRSTVSEKEYSRPIAEILRFSSNDVLTTSGDPVVSPKGVQWNDDWDTIV